MSKHSYQSIHAFMAPHSRSSIHTFAYTLHLCSCIHATALMLTLPHCHSFSQLSRWLICAAALTPQHFHRSIYSGSELRALPHLRCSSRAAALQDRCRCTRTTGSASANVEHDAGGPLAGAGVGGCVCVGPAGVWAVFETGCFGLGGIGWG